MDKPKFILATILLLGAFLRLYGLNWDNGNHLHPDERALIIAVEKLELPKSTSEFFSKESSWNPNFFAYGSFPMYTLRVAGSALSTYNPDFGSYTSINLVGRVLSSLADLLTIFFIFKIGQILFNKKTGLLASFFYAVSVLPIQLSHFFAVDTFLAFFITANLYFTLKLYQKQEIKNLILVGISLGLALSTKISSITLLVPIGLTLLFISTINKPKHKIINTSTFFINSLSVAFIAFLTFAIFMPYALIDFQNFWNQTLIQSQLTKNPFAFPYTLQYVGKIPYLYEIKNVFLWGVGPILGIISFAGAIYFVRSLFSKQKRDLQETGIIIFSLFLIYFLIVGNFAVGFMRYMLPLYPLLALFAGNLIYEVISKIKSRNLKFVISYLLLVISLVWPFSFAQIYSRPNTRTQASNWIYANIPPEKTLAIEHWDDQLPIGQPISYNTQILKLYDPDTDEKWREINSQLDQTDFIILASNRLYTPLQKLTDCENLPPGKCYARTADYYKKLLAGELGFKKIAEFTSFPTIPILSIPINDQSADENFTVFDHPKVIIFQKKPAL